MALTKQEKDTIVSEVDKLLSNAKLTVVAKYEGTTVKALQTLRSEAKENGTTVKVIKNRLVIKAVSANSVMSKADTSSLVGQLLYAFNDQDEVAPAQALAQFAKTNPNIEFVGGFTADGTFIGADDVKVLANLPSKDQLRAILVGILDAPLSGFVNVISGNVRGVLNVLNSRAEQIG